MMHKTHPTRVRVGLLWHSPNSGNLGVGALTLANMDLVRQAAEKVHVGVDFTIIGWVDHLPFYPQISQASAFALNGRQLVSPSGYARVVRDCEFILDIGAGDSFADLYGLKRFAYITATKAIALALHRPLVLAPQTIGPFSSTTTQLIAEQLVAASRVAFARDPMSVEAVRSARAREKIKLVTDVAFALPYDRERRSDRTRVGFNVSALLYHGGYTGKNQFGLKLDYPRFVEQVIEAFVGMPDVELVFVPHVIATGYDTEDDHALSARLASQQGLAPPRLFRDPIAAKSFISSCDFFIGSRMHACIGAVSSGIATAPVAYSRKFSGLFEGVGYHRTIDARGVDTRSAVEGVLEIYRNRHAASREAVQASDKAKELLRAYVSELANVLADLKDRVRRAA